MLSRLGYPTHATNESRRTELIFPVLNTGILMAAILIDSPLAGFLPVRVVRSLPKDSKTGKLNLTAVPESFLNTLLTIKEYYATCDKIGGQRCHQIFYAVPRLSEYCGERGNPASADNSLTMSSRTISLLQRTAPVCKKKLASCMESDYTKDAMTKSNEEVPMEADAFRFDGSRRCDLEKLDTSVEKNADFKERCLAQTRENLAKMAQIQDAFYADGREGLIVILQAMDAAGKDSTIKHVMAGLNPQGVLVHSFKQPSSEELGHDYLWRVNRHLPPRGSIAIFNRSYYEDVLTVQIHDLQKNYQMAPRVLNNGRDEFFRKRYHQICGYEEYLYDNSYRVVKIFLHISKKKQKERFLERIDIPEKNWKFSPDDVKDRVLFDRYQTLYSQVISETASQHSPWYVIPADRKWYTRFLVSQVVLSSLEACCHTYPELSPEAQSGLSDYRKQLESEPC